MALFGMKKKQAFGQMFDPMSNGPYGTPGIGDGMIERQQMGQAPQGMGQLPDVTNMPDMQQQQQPAKFKPNILGVIGDAMQVFGGGQATYMNAVREQQERSELMRQRAMMAQQERETGWQDWVKKEEYKRANPDPVNNDTVSDVKWFMGASPEERAAYREMNPEYRQGSDGKFYRIDTQQGPVPTFTEDDWNKGQPVGGSVGNGTGGFPYR